MLTRMWRNGNPLALLVGIQTGAIALENSVEVLQKIKNRTTLWSSNGAARNYPRGTRVLMHKGTCIPMFIAALIGVLSTIAKLWKEHKCPSTDEWIKRCGLYIQWNTTWQWKRMKSGICGNQDGTGGYCAKWNKPYRERQIPYVFTHMWILRNLTENHGGGKGGKKVTEREGGKP